MGEEKICKKCGSVYELSYTSTIMRDVDKIDCEVCGEILKKWSEAKIWDAKLIKRNDEHE